MKLNKIKLKKFIVPYQKKCEISNLTPYQVSGINRDKEFFEPSNQIGNDTSNYKEVPPNYFACNLMHAGRDVVLPIAMNTTSKVKFISPAYNIFKVESDEILAEYFFMYLKSTEKDRYFWQHTDSSVRDGMSWEDFIELEINIPSIEIQRKYIAIYQAMLKNQKSYEKGLEDLKLTCDVYIEELRKRIKSEEIGKYLVETRVKNEKGEKLKNKAVSNTKIFIDAKDAVFNGVDTKNYLIVNEKEFAYNTVTTRNADKLSIAYNNKEKCLVSPLYTTFKINNEMLLPEYLCLWFNRNEYDRYARFHSWGSARELYSFETLSQTQIPVPNLIIQKSIANVYSVYTERKEINEKLKEQIKNICPILIKGAIEEAKK